MRGGLEISVIVPVFNRGPAVVETLESCLAQEGCGFELIVVDDASTDGTRGVLEGYGDCIRLIALEESHGNGTFARTVGLRAAAGEFVKFLDHDDVLEPGTLAREVAMARAESADLVMSGWGVVDLDEAGCPVPDTERRYSPPACDRVIEAILGEGKTPYTAAALYRRELVADMEWDSAVALYDDFDWFARAALRARRIARSEHIAYWWRLHGGSFQAGTARDPLSYFHAERTRCLVYRKVEDALRESGRLDPRRRELLAAAYYRGLRAFSRWDPAFCRDVLGRMERLLPGWSPTRQSEGSAAIRVAIRVLGLRRFLGLYARLRPGHASVK